MTDWLDIGIKFALLHLGIVIFFGRKVLAAKMHESEGEPKISDYWKKHPTQTVISLAGSYAGFLILWGTDELTKAAALGVGFMADSIADAAVSKAKTNVEHK